VKTDDVSRVNHGGSKKLRKGEEAPFKTAKTPPRQTSNLPWGCEKSQFVLDWKTEKRIRQRQIKPRRTLGKRQGEREVSGKALRNHGGRKKL